MSKKDIAKIVSLLMAVDTAYEGARVAKAYENTVTQNRTRSCTDGNNMKADFSYDVNTKYTYMVTLRNGTTMPLSQVLSTQGKIHKGDRVWVDRVNETSWQANTESWASPEPETTTCTTTCECECECASSCFPKGTKIKMADGSQKDIKDVEIGDEVLTFDLNNREKKTGKVLGLESPIREGIYIIRLNNGKEFKVTNDHPMFTKKADGWTGWTSIDPEASKREGERKFEIKKTEMGDYFLSENLDWIEVEEIIYKEGEIRAYNLKDVENYNNFFAGTFLAHNKCGSCGCSCGCSSGSGCSGSCNCW